MNGNVEAESYPGVIEERLSIEVTTHCNIDCSHCFARAGMSKRTSLSVDLVKEIIDEGYNVGYRHLHITGGEPLLWEGLFEALDYAFDVGYQTVFLNTNGTVLTEDVSSRLTTYDGLSISVSLEGTEALHDHLRGEGSYSRTVRGIERALDGDIGLCIFATACKSLLPELSHFTDNLYKKFPNIEDLTLIQLIPAGDGVFSLSEELLEPEDFLQLVDMVSLLNLLGQRTRFLNNPLAYVASKLLKILWIPRSAPLYSEGSMIVMANRDICLSHSSRDSFGKYELGIIEKILASDGYRKAVAPDGITCPPCKYAELCIENGMDRPSEWCWVIQPDVPYCQAVLDSVSHYIQE
ncbi:MAG: radical SAM protein [Desulfobacteraceae bacterium]|nr:radical SAM protein [Desulfobacteraceae bacterium]